MNKYESSYELQHNGGGGGTCYEKSAERRGGPRALLFSPAYLTRTHLTVSVTVTGDDDDDDPLVLCC